MTSTSTAKAVLETTRCRSGKRYRRKGNYPPSLSQGRGVYKGFANDKQQAHTHVRVDSLTSSESTDLSEQPSCPAQRLLRQEA